MATETAYVSKFVRGEKYWFLSVSVPRAWFDDLAPGDVGAQFGQVAKAVAQRLNERFAELSSTAAPDGPGMPGADRHPGPAPVARW